MKLILKNGWVIDPRNKTNERRDVAIDDTVLVDPDTIARAADVDVIDVGGCVITPGLIDIHVHLREPGYTYKEDIATGTRCAAAGGFTTVLAMPNTKPPIDSLAVVRELQERIRQTAIVEVLLTVAITRGRAGKELTDIAGLAKEKLVAAISDDGDCVEDRELMLHAMSLAKSAGLPLVDHCEDRALSAGGVMRRGISSDYMGVPGMPGETESAIVARDVELCCLTGCKTHIQHISFCDSVALVRQARKDGLPVTAEVSPHHLTLTDGSVPILGTAAKMNPPLGTADDRRNLTEALADGTISAIATDHAPHAPAEKARSFVDAPFGIIGLETAFPICHTALCETGILDLPTLITRFTVGPASILGIDRGHLSLGARADVAIIDPRRRYRIDIRLSHSKSRNSPFHNQSVVGKVVGTIAAGRWVHRDPDFGKP